jgi:hypothetical protein
LVAKSNENVVAILEIVVTLILLKKMWWAISQHAVIQGHGLLRLLKSLGMFTQVMAKINCKTKQCMVQILAVVTQVMAI